MVLVIPEWMTEPVGIERKIEEPYTALEFIKQIEYLENDVIGVLNTRLADIRRLYRQKQTGEK